MRNFYSSRGRKAVKILISKIHSRSSAGKYPMEKKWERKIGKASKRLERVILQF